MLNSLWVSVRPQGLQSSISKKFAIHELHAYEMRFLPNCHFRDVSGQSSSQNGVSIDIVSTTRVKGRTKDEKCSPLVDCLSTVRRLRMSLASNPLLTATFHKD